MNADLIRRLRGPYSTRTQEEAAAALEAAEAQLKMVLDREAATAARHDAKLDAAEAEVAQWIERHDQKRDALFAALARTEAAEAALRQLVSAFNVGTGPELYRAVEDARAALVGRKPADDGQ